MRKRSPLLARFSEAFGLSGQKSCSIYMKLVVLFAEAAMGHVTLLSCVWHLSLAVIHQLAWYTGLEYLYVKKFPAKPGSRFFTTELPVCRGKIFLHKRKWILYCKPRRRRISANRAPLQSGPKRATLSYINRS